MSDEDSKLLDGRLETAKWLANKWLANKWLANTWLANKRLAKIATLPAAEDDQRDERYGGSVGYYSSALARPGQGT